MRGIDRKLFDAVEQGNLDRVQRCLNEGANVLARNSHHTVLHSAVSGNNEEVIKLVLNKIEKTQNQYIDAKDTEGDTPLMWAAEYGRVNAAEVLLDHGANTEVKNNDGMTALHWAAKENESRVAKLLIDNGADVYAEDKDGKKPIDLARERNHSSVEKLLYENDYSLNEVAAYVGEVAVETAEVAGTVALVTAAGVAGLAIDAAVAVGEVAVGVVQAVADAATTEPSEYDVERRGRLEAAAGGAQPGSLHYYQKTEHVRREEDGCIIQSYQKQQKTYLHLSQFVSHNLQNASIELVKQGLYLPSFEARNVKINGKCTAITRGLSQALLLQSSKSFLSNLKTSAKIYERVAQGKQISKREEREVFAFSKLLSNFERQLDSTTNSLPSSLIHNKCYKTLDDLSSYIAGVKGDFAIHLVTSNHVVAVYRTGDNYACFDSNTAFISGLESIDQLIEIVEKGTGYKVGEKGFLVEHFNIDRANNQLSDKGKRVLTKEIKTERQLLAEQDEKFGPIKSMVNRVQLYDFGTKIHVEGSVPLLINADINLSSKKFQDHLDKKEVSMAAREYLDSLKNSKDMEGVVQATKAIPFIGCKREIEEAEQTRKPLLELIKGTINFILTTASLTSTSRLKSQLPKKADDKPRTCLNDPTVDNQPLFQAISF